MHKYDILREYFYNQSVFLHKDIIQLQENLRYRNISDIDCLELIIAKARYDMFMQVSDDVCHLLGFRLNYPKN